MSRRVGPAIVAVVLMLTAPASVLAHADLHERIEDLSRQILAAGDRPELYLKRGELHRVHQDWPSALRDYASAEQLAQGDLPVVAYFRGRMWLEAGEPERSRFHLNLYLSGDPDHVGALTARSRAYARLGREREAVRVLDEVLQRVGRLRPEYFLERAKLQAKLGDARAAIIGLEEGIRRLGPVVTIVDHAIELEISMAEFDRALRRLDSLPPFLLDQPGWLVRRAEILAAADRFPEARRAYQAALARIQDLPEHRARARANRELEEKIRRFLSGRQ